MRLMERTKTTRYQVLHALQPTLRYMSTNQLTTLITVCYNGEVSNDNSGRCCCVFT